MATRLQALGGLTGRHEEAEIGWLRSHAQRAALLLYLAVEGETTRDTLLALLWRDVEADTAGHRLSQLLYSLRQVVGDDALESRGRTLTCGSAVSIDVADFEASAARGSLAEAVELYRGPFLEGVHLVETHTFEDWVASRRSRYARLFRKVCRALTAEREGAGDLDGALAVAQAWVAADGTDDEAQHRLIELLSRAGERSAALQQYASYTKLLQQEELQPLDETRQLVAAIERASSGRASTTVDPSKAGAGDAVTSGPNLSGAPASSTPTLGSVATRDQRSRRTILVWGIAALLSVVSATTVLLRAGTEVDAAVLPRLAVLPLHAVDGADELQPLAMGISVRLHGALSSVAGLRVSSMHAMLRYRQAQMNLDSLGQVLGADWLIGGTLNRVGGRMHVMVEVFDADSSRVIATHSSEGLPSEELRLIEDVVGGAEVMLRELLGRELRLTRWRAGSGNREAFLAMASAYGAVGDADRLLEDNDRDGALDRLHEATQLLDRASVADPGWLEPLIEHARVSRKRAFLLYGTAGPVAGDSIRAAIGRGLLNVEAALAMEPGAPRALEARGELHYAAWLLTARGDTALRRRAEEDLDAAMSGDTTLARAAYVRAAIHFLRGEFQRARVLLDHAYERDALLDGGRELLTRLYTYNFESGLDQPAKSWCLKFERDYGEEWFTSYCRLQLLVWDSTATADVDSAWFFARRGRRSTALIMRDAQGSQLVMLVAGVVARAGLGDSAQRVIALARQMASRDALGRMEPHTSVLDRLEADARIHLGQVDSAGALLHRVAQNNPPSIDALRQSRRARSIPGVERWLPRP